MLSKNRFSVLDTDDKMDTTSERFAVDSKPPTEPHLDQDTQQQTNLAETTIQGKSSHLTNKPKDSKEKAEQGVSTLTRSPRKARGGSKPVIGAGSRRAPKGHVRTDYQILQRGRRSPKRDVTAGLTSKATPMGSGKPLVNDSSLSTNAPPGNDNPATGDKRCVDGKPPTSGASVVKKKPPVTGKASISSAPIAYPKNAFAGKAPVNDTSPWKNNALRTSDSVATSGETAVSSQQNPSRMPTASMPLPRSVGRVALSSPAIPPGLDKQAYGWNHPLRRAPGSMDSRAVYYSSGELRPALIWPSH